MRAEDLKLNLTEVGESFSDRMMCSLVLKGLSKEFDSFVTVVNYGGSVKDFSSLKRDLINFASDRKVDVTASSLHVGQSSVSGMKCFQCKKPGHKKADCPERKSSSGTCHLCKKPGHYARDCRQSKKCTYCNKTGHLVDTCYALGASKKENNAMYSSRTVEYEGFSFSSVAGRAEVQSSCEFIIDSGCTGYMLKDKHLFTSLVLGSSGKVGNAEAGSVSSVEGVGTACLWALDSTGCSRRI